MRRKTRTCDYLSVSQTMTAGRTCTRRHTDRRYNVHSVLLFIFLCYLPIPTVQAVVDIVMEQDTCVLDAHCLHGGLCMPGDETTPFKHCHCPPGFAGPRCAHYCPYDCQNGGYCAVTPVGEAVGLTRQKDDATPPEPGTYMCKCFGRFTGPFCEIPYVNCGHTGRCFNEGVCELNDDAIRRCSCPKGYSGENCELKIEKADKIGFKDKLSIQMNGVTKLLIGSVGLFILTVLALLALCLTGKPGQYKFDHVPINCDEQEWPMPEYVETGGRRHKGIQLNVV